MSEHYDRYNGMEKLLGTDSISRQAAINKILGQPPEPRYPSWYAEQIKELPSAQSEPLKIDLSGYSEEDWERLKKEWGNTPITVLSAQPKTGKWIEYEQKFMTDRPFETIKKHVRECSLCRTKIAGFDGTMRYCPNCGAKMEVTT